MWSSELKAHAFSRRLVSLASARHLLVCADYDGTLAPIALRPGQAQMLPGACALLQQLARLPDTRVAIISGRSLADLRSHSGIEEPVMLVGSHGAEMPGLPSSPVDPPRLALLETVASSMSSLCSTAAGAWLERKPLGMAIHVRQATHLDADRILMQARQLAVTWPALQVKSGKAVLELSLSSSNKGQAVQQLRTDWGTEPQVMYLGDDVTDEDAFGVLGPGDLGVKVGSGTSVARYRVVSEHAATGVLTFLTRFRASVNPMRSLEHKSRVVAT